MQAQQAAMEADRAQITTGLLFTEAAGETPSTLVSNESDEAFRLAWRYLQSAPAIKRQPQGSKQIAGHVETKAAAVMREDGDTYGVLVVNNPTGPCTYGSGIGCQTAMALILPRGSQIVVWWPGGRHGTFAGEA